MHFLERGFLSFWTYKNPFYWGDYTFTTFPFVLSIFLLFLSDREIDKDTVFNKYGRHTLWAYILHPALLGAFLGITRFIEYYLKVDIAANIVWSILISGLTYKLIMDMVLTDTFEKAVEKISSCMN